MTYDLYIKELDLDVELDCRLISCNDGIGSYEYWGSKEYDKGEDYLDIDEMTWDKTLYTEEENNIIDQYIKDNRDKITEKALKDYDPY